MLFNCVVIIEKIYKNRQHTSCPHFQNLLPPGVNPVTSTNILGVSMLVQPVETRQNPSRPVETRRNMLQPVETRFNPFRSVQTRLNLNLSKHVQTCWNRPPPFSPLPLVETRQNPFRLTRLNLSKHVQTCWNAFPLLPPPFSPLFPSLFFLGGGGGGRGREREGKTPPPKTPGRGRGGTKSPPLPHRILTTKSNQNSQNLCNLLQNLCNLPTYTLEVSLSPLLLKTT